MIRSLSCLTLAVVLAGCHSSPTSRFATRSITRVPPPGTNSYSTTPGNPYYEGNSKPGRGFGASETGASVGGLATTTGNAANSAWQSRGTVSDLTTPVGTAVASLPASPSNIIVASPTPSVAPATFLPTFPALNSSVNSTVNTGGLRLRGMTVNDGTTQAEPATFVAPNSIRPVTPTFQPIQPAPMPIQAAPMSSGPTGWLPSTMPISVAPPGQPVMGTTIAAAPVLPMTLPTMNFARTELLEVPVRMTPATGTPTMSPSSSGSSSNGVWKSKSSAG